MLTLRQVNKKLKELYGDIELVKGDGYLYFVSEHKDFQDSTMVYVDKLNDLTLDRWLEEAAAVIKRN